MNNIFRAQLIRYIHTRSLNRRNLIVSVISPRTVLRRNARIMIESCAQPIWQGTSHAGIILSRQQPYSVGEQMRRLLKLIATKSAEAMRSRVEFLNAWG